MIINKFLDHITTDGERWDSLAFKYYGNPLSYVGLVEANKSYAHLPNLMSGLRLRIPVLDRPATRRKSLPPWRK